MLELDRLEHQVSVVLLSNPEMTAKIESLQKSIKESLHEFSTKLTSVNTDDVT